MKIVYQICIQIFFTRIMQRFLRLCFYTVTFEKMYLYFCWFLKKKKKRKRGKKKRKQKKRVNHKTIEPAF